MPGVTIIFLPAVTVVVAAAVALSNWDLLTASLGSVPSATFVILLPPLSRPSFVRLTLLPPAGLIVIPSPLITVLLPPFVKVVDVNPCNSFANFTFNVPLPSDTTPILLSDNLAASAPPLIVTVSPNFLLLTAPVSPAKFKPFSRVLLISEISCLFLLMFCVLLAISPAFLLMFCLLPAISCLFLSMSDLFVLTLSLTFFN